MSREVPEDTVTAHSLALTGVVVFLCLENIVRIFNLHALLPVLPRVVSEHLPKNILAQTVIKLKLVSLLRQRLVNSLDLFGLRRCYSLEVNIFLDFDCLAADQLVALGSLDELRQNPRLALPLLHAALDDLTVLIRGSLCFLLGAFVSFALEDQVK